MASLKVGVKIEEFTDFIGFPVPYTSITRPLVWKCKSVREWKNTVFSDKNEIFIPKVP